MCCSFHEEAGGEILNDYYLKYLTSGHPNLRSLTFVHARRDRFSSSEPLNVHFSIGIMIGIGYSHVKERNFLPLWARGIATREHAAGLRTRIAILPRALRQEECAGEALSDQFEGGRGRARLLEFQVASE